MSTANMKHLPSGQGQRYWEGSDEFVTIKSRADETGGDFGLVEVVALPGAEPPAHIHTGFDEAYYLLEGELDVLDGDRVFRAKAGSYFFIPRGTLHTWRNASSEPVRALVSFIPGGFERMIEEVGTPAVDHESPPPPPPAPTPEDLERLNELGRKYDTEYPDAPSW